MIDNTRMFKDLKNFYKNTKRQKPLQQFPKLS